jgi:hypothetical protein
MLALGQSYPERLNSYYEDVRYLDIFQLDNNKVWSVLNNFLTPHELCSYRGSFTEVYQHSTAKILPHTQGQRK